MRKGTILAVLGTVLTAVGCLAAWHISENQGHEISLTSDLSSVERELEGPKIVSLDEFDLQEMAMSLPPKYKGIPLLVGAISSTPVHEADGYPLHLIGRTMLQYETHEAGSLEYQGYARAADLPVWLLRSAKRLANLSFANDALVRYEVYYVGVAWAPKPKDVEIEEGKFLILEQRHYVVSFARCSLDNETPQISFEGRPYSLGQPFTLHVACLGTLSKGPSLNPSSCFYGVTEE